MSCRVVKTESGLKVAQQKTSFPSLELHSQVTQLASEWEESGLSRIFPPFLSFPPMQDRNMANLESHGHCWPECKIIWPLWKKVLWLPPKLKTELLHDPATPQLSMGPKELRSVCGSATRCLHSVLFATLLTIAKIWNQLSISR